MPALSLQEKDDSNLVMRFLHMYELQNFLSHQLPQICMIIENMKMEGLAIEYEFMHGIDNRQTRQTNHNTMQYTVRTFISLRF